MRLLNTQTLTFKEFLDSHHTPKYAIASHRWGADEATMLDIQEKRNTLSPGYRKVEAFATYVNTHIPDLQWMWIDTCCINKRDAVELSYSVNSMFRWYRDAEVCLAYLEDVFNVDDGLDLEGSVWFRRGWTLQELIAPALVVFLTKNWQVLGHKGRSRSGRSGVPLHTGARLNDRIARITGIPEAVLQDHNHSSGISIEEKFSWMEGRQTTEEEDFSYCLLGILDVSMVIIYGEGEEFARSRLLRAISKRHLIQDGSTSGPAIAQSVEAGFSNVPFRLNEIIRSEPLPRNVDGTATSSVGAWPPLIDHSASPSDSELSDTESMRSTFPSTSSVPRDIDETVTSRQGPWPSLIDSSALPSDSEVSDAESMSSLVSSRSLASSISSLGSTGWTEETIRGFVDQIFCTTQFTEVHRAALEEEAIGTERYRRNLQRMIANFGITAKSEAAVPNQLFAARVISSRRMSETVARVIVEQNDRPRQSESHLHTHRSITAREDPILEMSTKTVDNKNVDDSASVCSEASTDQEEPEDIVGEQFLAAKQFLEGSHAFSEFQQSLIEFVHQPYEKRVWQCLTLTSGNSNNTGDNDGRGPLPFELVIDQHRLDALINEMSWVPTNIFEFCSSRQLTLMDRLKILVEDLMRAELNWQPFSPPTRQLPVGFMRIKWQTVRQIVATKQRVCRKLRSRVMGCMEQRWLSDEFMTRSFLQSTCVSLKRSRF
jgi:hypothetical protein